MDEDEMADRAVSALEAIAHGVGRLADAYEKLLENNRHSAEMQAEALEMARERAAMDAAVYRELNIEDRADPVRRTKEDPDGDAG